jgi:hypothetical protein
MKSAIDDDQHVLDVFRAKSEIDMHSLSITSFLEYV